MTSLGQVFEISEKEGPRANVGLELRNLTNRTQSLPKTQEHGDYDGLFKAAMAGAGLETTDPLIPDGKLHRFGVSGDKPGQKNGYYLFHPDHPPSGAYGSWRLGIKGKWCAKSDAKLTNADWETIKRRNEAARLERQQQTDQRHAKTKQRALAIWQLAAFIQLNGHPYLDRKGVQAHGLRVGTWIKKSQDADGIWQENIIENSLMVSMIDWENKLWNLQAIFPTKNEILGRDKDFLSGGRKVGLFWPLGEIDETTGTLLVAEGYATAATLYETTGKPVLVAFDAGNLLPVAVEARRRFPAIDLVIATDNDRHTAGNPGLTKGRAAAVASSARLFFPPFADDEPGSDWNDWHLLRKGTANV